MVKFVLFDLFRVALWTSTFYAKVIISQSYICPLIYSLLDRADVAQEADLCEVGLVDLLVEVGAGLSYYNNLLGSLSCACSLIFKVLGQPHVPGEAPEGGLSAVSPKALG